MVAVPANICACKHWDCNVFPSEIIMNNFRNFGAILSPLDLWESRVFLNTSQSNKQSELRDGLPHPDSYCPLLALLARARA